MADLKITTRPPKGRAAKRWGWRCLSGALALVLLVGVGIGVAAIRLSNGPMRIDGLSARVAEAVAERIGPGWSIAIRGSSLELDRDNALALRFAGLDIRNPQGALVVRAPLALVSLDPWGLLQLSLKPRSIEFRDTQTTALIHKDGSIAFAASEAARPADVEPHTPPSVDAARGTVSPLSAALASIFGWCSIPAAWSAPSTGPGSPTRRCASSTRTAGSGRSSPGSTACSGAIPSTAPAASSCASTGRTGSGASAAACTRTARGSAPAASPSTTCR